MTEVAHALGSILFGDDYTVERREFADGDSRTLVKHTIGWGSENYLDVLIWMGRDEIWLEYVEGDVRRYREVRELGDHKG